MTLNFLRGPGNHHLELSRMLWGLSVLAGIGYAGWHLYLNHTFSIIEYATGMGALLLGGGGATAIKDQGVAKAVATASGDAA